MASVDSHSKVCFFHLNFIDIRTRKLNEKNLITKGYLLVLKFFTSVFENIINVIL